LARRIFFRSRIDCGDFHQLVVAAGGSLPAAIAANRLADAWDHNAALFAQSPVGS
jgi:hypothetical protein